MYFRFLFSGSDGTKKLGGFPDFVFTIREGEEFKSEVFVIPGFLDHIQYEAVINFTFCDLAACRYAGAMDMADPVNIVLDGVGDVSFDLLEVEDVIKHQDVLAAYFAKDVEGFLLILEVFAA